LGRPPDPAAAVRAPPESAWPGSFELGLLAAALVARLGVALVSSTDLWFDHVFNDAAAWNLAQGHGFSASAGPPFEPAIFRTPGYPAFLALVYGAVGHSVVAGFLANALLDTASCALLWGMAARDMGRPAARWVLLLAATYPFTAHAVGSVSPESLLVFAGLLFVAAVRALPPAGWSWWLPAAGVVFAAMAWVKPVVLPLPAFLLLAERLRGRDWRTAAVRAAVVGAVGLALFAPWILRNQRAFGRPVLAGELGLVLWHGTRDFHEGLESEIQGNFDAASQDPADRYEQTRAFLADSPEVLRQDDAHRAEAMAILRGRPLDALVLDPLRRVPRLWVSVRHVQMAPWVGKAAFAACIAYLALAALGLLALRGRLRELAAWWILPVAFTLAYAAIHVEARYTLPARPTLLLLAGAGLHAWLPRLGMVRPKEGAP
jgi:4-amino-4-deoxy-L-arabinose transferase-like glycosyltransferase